MAVQRTTNPRRIPAPRPGSVGRIRPDLRLGTAAAARSGVALGTGPADRLVARHTVQTSAAQFSLTLLAPTGMSRRTLGAAIADAVAELRAFDITYSPLRPGSLVSLLRRGEVAPDAYPPLADIVGLCDAMRAATDGWFDAWAVPGGFDPSGLSKGWAVERVAARLRATGIEDYAVISGGDLTVRGRAPHGGPWRIDVHHPHDTRRAPMMLEMTEGAVGTSGVTGRRGHVIDPHTGNAVHRLRAATVTGPDLAVADAYATALYAAGATGLDWFPTADGYRALFAG